MPVLSSPPAENSRPTRKYCLLIMQSVRLAASTSHGSDSERHSGEMMLARVGTCTYVPCFTLPVGTLFTACIRPSTLASQQLDPTLPSSFRLPSIYSIFPKHPNHYLRYLPYQVKIWKLPGRYLVPIGRSAVLRDQDMQHSVWHYAVSNTNISLTYHSRMPPSLFTLPMSWRIPQYLD